MCKTYLVYVKTRTTSEQIMQFSVEVKKVKICMCIYVI